MIKEFYKDSKKVHLQDTFFLDPSITKDGQGGEYQVRWFVVHKGSSDKWGHYVNYRLTEKGWYCHDDTSSYPAAPKDVEAALETCCLIFATKTSTRSVALFDRGFFSRLVQPSSQAVRLELIR